MCITDYTTNTLTITCNRPIISTTLDTVCVLFHLNLNVSSDTSNPSSLGIRQFLADYLTIIHAITNIGDCDSPTENTSGNTPMSGDNPSYILTTIDA